ncbi:Pentatricopeptide repeat-containing protein [Sesamum angolense]|uniref:Pentatricopeptide repeat-containing protein n=1 Tax=Sesamum angolense TaxID=2727404 RepID=A0AAE1W2Y9_9LAMI|nr:Pentatricopeptide repeat-containing protein [Sesamum angolense]
MKLKWTILISGFSRYGHHRIALDYFAQMQNQGVVSPNAFTLSTALKSCSCVNNGLRMGKSIHGWMIRNGIDADVALNNAVLDLYAKFRVFDYVKRFFGLMDDKDSTSWNIVLAANLSKGEMYQSLGIFWRLPTNPLGIQSLMDFYNMDSTDVHWRCSKESHDDLMAQTVSWSTMIAGYVQHANPYFGRQLDLGVSMQERQLRKFLVNLGSIDSVCCILPTVAIPWIEAKAYLLSVMLRSTLRSKLQLERGAGPVESLPLFPPPTHKALKKGVMIYEFKLDMGTETAVLLGNLISELPENEMPYVVMLQYTVFQKFIRLKRHGTKGKAEQEKLGQKKVEFLGSLAIEARYEAIIGHLLWTGSTKAKFRSRIIESR